MLFGSVCSGIEAASVAWHPLGWRAAWLSEIEPFPCAVLAHHYPDVPNLGDMTKLTKRILSGEVEAPDVFCGGTPCQAFSVAGLRKSLDDARGNLSLTFCEIANAIDTIRAQRGQQPATIFWENVPGVLSTADNAFGCFLAGLAGEDGALQPPGGRWSNAGCVLGPQRAVAWRVLDAQYFGVAQRRRRVFVVASARNGFDPAQVLFEFDGLRRDTAPSREAREDVTHATAPCLTSSCRGVERTGDTRGQDPVVAVEMIAAGNAEGGTGLPFLTCSNIGKTVNNQTPLMAFASTTHTLRGEGLLQQTCPAGTARDAGTNPKDQIGGGHGALAVRRLLPVECERLQGFPDFYTQIPWRKKPASDCPDGPRYKALGNSWAVPVVRWIGERIEQQTRIKHDRSN